jgi:hypothetical protein
MRQRFDNSSILAYEIHHIVKIFIRYNDCCHMLCLYLCYVPNSDIIVSFYAMYKSPAFVLLPLSCCIQIYFYYRRFFSIYIVLDMYIISGGGRTNTCVIQRASGGAECAVRCVHMCSVGMGQGN